MNRGEIDQRAGKIARRIIEDCKERAGLRGEFEAIEDDTLHGEIIPAWVKIIGDEFHPVFKRQVDRRELVHQAEVYLTTLKENERLQWSNAGARRLADLLQKAFNTGAESVVVRGLTIKLWAQLVTWARGKGGLTAEDVKRSVSELIVFIGSVFPGVLFNRWVPIEERRPTELDALNGGLIPTLFTDGSRGYVDWEVLAMYDPKDAAARHPEAWWKFEWRT